MIVPITTVAGGQLGSVSTRGVSESESALTDTTSAIGKGLSTDTSTAVEKGALGHLFRHLSLFGWSSSASKEEQVTVITETSTSTTTTATTMPPRM